MATNIIITRASAQVAESAVHSSCQVWTAVGIGVVFAALLFKPFFGDWSGFWDCVKFWMKPDWISWWQGEGVEDWWAEMKLGVWILLAGVCGVASYFKLPIWLPGLFG
jgi:hypothetical protein